MNHAKRNDRARQKAAQIRRRRVAAKQAGGADNLTLTATGQAAVFGRLKQEQLIDRGLRHSILR